MSLVVVSNGTMYTDSLYIDEFISKVVKMDKKLFTTPSKYTAYASTTASFTPEQNAAIRKMAADVDMLAQYMSLLGEMPKKLIVAEMENLPQKWVEYTYLAHEPVIGDDEIYCSILFMTRDFTVVMGREYDNARYLSGHPTWASIGAGDSIGTLLHRLGYDVPKIFEYIDHHTAYTGGPLQVMSSKDLVRPDVYCGRYAPLRKLPTPEARFLALGERMTRIMKVHQEGLKLC